MYIFSLLGDIMVSENERGNNKPITDNDVLSLKRVH